MDSFTDNSVYIFLWISDPNPTKNLEITKKQQKQIEQTCINIRWFLTLSYKHFLYWSDPDPATVNKSANKDNSPDNLMKQYE